MRARSVTPTTSPQSLYTLVGDTRHCKCIGLQAPTGNGDVIYFGDEQSQPGELAAGASATLWVSSTRNVYVYGDGSDTVSIFFFQD